jgi:hypothetical protein
VGSYEESRSKGIIGQTASQAKAEFVSIYSLTGTGTPTGSLHAANVDAVNHV